MKNNAQKWLASLENVPTHFKHNEHGEEIENKPVQSFSHLFKAKFSTTKQKVTWQKQLFEIKQGLILMLITLNHSKKE